MLTLVLLTVASASEEGIVGYAWDGCSDCHKGTTPDAVTVTLAAEKTTVSGGETIPLTLTVASTEPSHIQAGLNVGAEDGLLTPGATLLFRDYEITHQFPHDMTDGAMAFDLSWTAPAYAGSFTLSGVGNAVDGISTATGDIWARDELILTVVSDCSDVDGDRVGDCEGDCDDTDETVYPDAVDTWYDGIDSDCAGDDDFDADADGVALSEDCDDTDSAIGACEEDSGKAGPGEPTDTDPEEIGFEPERGCKGSAAVLVSLSLLGFRRRQSLQTHRQTHPRQR
ncbi:MAG: hypothetical protein ACI8RZ_003270 [Myxococcota bacterium]|jgi:hypothetical protein